MLSLRNWTAMFIVDFVRYWLELTKAQKVKWGIYNLIKFLIVRSHNFSWVSASLGILIKATWPLSDLLSFIHLEVPRWTTIAGVATYGTQSVWLQMPEAVSKHPWKNDAWLCIIYWIGQVEQHVWVNGKYSVTDIHTLCSIGRHGAHTNLCTVFVQTTHGSGSQWYSASNLIYRSESCQTVTSNLLLE